MSNEQIAPDLSDLTTHQMLALVGFHSKNEPTRSNSYSDYGYEGHFLALRDLSRELLQEIVDECRAEHRSKEDDPDYWGNPDSLFLPNLIRRGLVVDIDVQEIHTGSYGELSLP